MDSEFNDYPRINRLETINQDGRTLTTRNIENVEIHIQDSGQTMKIFYHDIPESRALQYESLFNLDQNGHPSVDEDINNG